jgi:caffeoyl-CoA O-methyltransferase
MEASMISLVSTEVERYAIEHTSPLPPYLQELTRVTQEKMEAPKMLVGPVEGMLLQLLVWATDARRVLEIGTFTGFSAQMMAAALPEDGVLITCDIDPKAAKVAREYFEKSPHGHKIELRMGQALETLRSLDGPFDLVFIDADKESYIAYYDRAMEMLSPRGIIAVDNVLWGGRVLSPVSESDHAIARFNSHVRQDPRVRHVLLPVRDGVMLVRRA